MMLLGEMLVGLMMEHHRQLHKWPKREIEFHPSLQASNCQELPKTDLAFRSMTRVIYRRRGFLAYR
jgi:hypothetical protein